MQAQGKRKRENGGEEEESSGKRAKIDTMPLEIMELLWVGHLTHTEKEEGVWALLLVFRRVSREWRDYLEDKWRAARENITQGTSFPLVAARCGWLQLLQWAVNQGWSQKNRKEVLASAARGGHIEILEWIGTRFLSSSAVLEAVEAGDLEALLWCINHSGKRKRKFLWKRAAGKAASVGDFRCCSSC